jgi:hypothetical protein
LLAALLVAVFVLGFSILNFDLSSPTHGPDIIPDIPKSELPKADVPTTNVPTKPGTPTHAEPPEPPGPPPPVPPGPGTAPPVSAIEEPRPRPVPLVWNAWSDSWPGPTYRPLPRLRPDTDYLLMLHLSAFDYGAAAGVLSQSASGELGDWADTWLDTGAATAALTILPLADKTFFEPRDERPVPLVVDLRRLRSWLRTRTHPEEPAPLDKVRALQQEGSTMPPFVFGEVALRFRTTSREGVGAMALAIWSDRPVDEMTLHFCVSSASATDAGAAARCAETNAVDYSLKGLDSVRIATEGKTRPDASLHFVELEGRGMVGLFRDNGCASCGYVVWDLGLSGAALARHLSDTTLDAFGPFVTSQALAAAGRGLYGLLFPDTPAGRKARDALERFARPAAARASRADRAERADHSERTRSIFVRSALDLSNATPLQLPLGLVVLSPPGAPPEFLGLRVRVESPLGLQQYGRPSRCVSRWFFAVPPANPGSRDALPQARGRFESLMADWRPRVELFDGIAPFRDWLEQPATEPDAAVVVVSHHDRNSLYFEPNDRLNSDQVNRAFGEASLLILDGCSTGAPSAVDLLQRFNRHGVPAIIASYAAVRPQMAGDFIKTFGAAIAKAPAGLSVSELFQTTIEQLSDARPDDVSEPYGPRVLVFALLGNGGVRICAPRKGSS